jgi:hypothetical protein
MAYVHCHHCNAKALAGATRCPRCEASFLETPPRRESEVPRRRTCPTCGDEHLGRHDACASCRNRERARAQARATRGVRLGMGIAAAVVIVAFGVRGIASRMSQATPTVARDATGLAAAPVGADAGEPQSPAVTAPATPVVSAPMNNATPSTATPPASPAAEATVAAAPASRLIAITGDPPRTAVVDHAIRWVEAFAPRSMYLRTAPDRAATIARVIQAEEPVLLGPIVAGWRMARAGGIDGYVAARFFTLD